MREWIKLFEDIGQQQLPQNAQQAPAAQPQQQPPQKQVPQQAAQADQGEMQLLKKVLKQDYPTFVKLLGQHIKDPKFVAAIQQLSELDKVNLRSISVPCTKLTPTQNEIDITKSLSYPLKDPKNVDSYLQGGPVTVGGNPIITSGGGRFIVDGHHRWSQVYLINPNCQMSAIDISDIKGPFQALKAAQLGIAVATHKIEIANVEGANLMTIGQQEFVQYVMQNIDDSVIDVLRKYKLIKTPNNDERARGEAANYIWNNVLSMRKTSSPIDGAPPRGLMPQTDTAKDQWSANAPNPETTVTEVELIKKLAGLRN